MDHRYRGRRRRKVDKDRKTRNSLSTHKEEPLSSNSEDSSSSSDEDLERTPSRRSSTPPRRKSSRLGKSRQDEKTTPRASETQPSDDSSESSVEPIWRTRKSKSPSKSAPSKLPKRGNLSARLPDDEWQELCRRYEQEFEGSQAAFLRSSASGDIKFTPTNEKKFSVQLRFYREAAESRAAHSRSERVARQKESSPASGDLVDTSSEGGGDKSDGEDAKPAAVDDKVSTRQARVARNARKDEGRGEDTEGASETKKVAAEKAESSEEDTVESARKKKSNSRGNSSSSAENSDSDESCHAKIVKQGRHLPDMLEFSVHPIQHLFICSLCKGFYREPYTITKCLHQFCKSCLVLNMAFQEEQFVMREAHYSCPECREYLGCDWKKHALPNPALQNLMDKVLFCDMAAKDEEEERLFYERKGIKRNFHQSNGNPEDPRSSTTSPREAKRGNVGTKSVPAKAEQIMLVPLASDEDEPCPPSLEKPYLEVPGNIRVAQLKKYVSMKLPSSSLLGRIFCSGASLGNEWTVEFVKRTMWMPEDTEENPILTLHYC